MFGYSIQHTFNVIGTEFHVFEFYIHQRLSRKFFCTNLKEVIIHLAFKYVIENRFHGNMAGRSEWRLAIENRSIFLKFLIWMIWPCSKTKATTGNNKLVETALLQLLWLYSTLYRKMSGVFWIKTTRSK